jgi:hypothetical protein
MLHGAAPTSRNGPDYSPLFLRQLTRPLHLFQEKTNPVCTSASPLGLQEPWARMASNDLNRSLLADEPNASKQSTCCSLRGLVQLFNQPIFQTLVVVWLLLVIVDGAFFFLLLVGWLDLGSTDLNNKWLNLSIQALNVLFTYISIFNLPARAQRFRELCDEECERQRDMEDIFNHLTWRQRVAIIVLLLLNCITQFINQGFRCIYYTFELSAEHVWQCNTFFALSFGTAIFAAIWEGLEERKLRHSGKYNGPRDALHEFIGEDRFTFAALWSAIHHKLIRGDNHTLLQTSGEPTEGGGDAAAEI